MALHPEEPKRHVSDEVDAALWNPPQQYLTNTEDWSRDLVEHSQDLLCAHDLEGRFLSVNPVPARLLGYSVEEMILRPMRDFLDPRFHSQFDDYMREIKRRGEAHGVLAVMTRTGERRLWEYHNTLRTEGVARPMVRGIAHDITDRILAERALRASNEQLTVALRRHERVLQEVTLFRTLLDHSNDSIVVLDPATWRFLDANNRTCLELGYSRRDLLSMTFLEIESPEAGSSCSQIREQVEKSGSATIEGVHRRKNGTTFAVEVSLGRVEIDREYYVAVCRDITARKVASEVLQQSEARARAKAKDLETLLDVLPIPVLVAHDAQCRQMTANRMGRELLRLQYGENASMSAPVDQKPRLRFLRDGVEIEAEQLPMQLAAATGQPVHNARTTVVYQDGSKRHEITSAVPLLDEEGKIRGAIGAALDITELKRQEAESQASEERLRLAQEVAKIGIFDRDLLTGESRWSPEMEAMYGLAPGTFPRSTDAFLDLVHPEDRSHVAQLIERSIQAGDADGEWRIIWQDGSVHWISGRWRHFRDEQGRPARFLGMDFDITARKQAEEAFRQSEERFRVALKNSPIAVFNQDRDLRYTWLYSPSTDMATGPSPGESLADFFGVEEGQRVTNVRQRVLETGLGVRHEVEILRNGRKRYFDSTVEPLFDSAGAVVGLTGASMDITEFREATDALREAKRKLTEEKLYLEAEINTELGFGEIVGRSRALQNVMENVGKVAASDATVLLLGETGTGKELVARAIHRLSHRARASFIKMNCAAIPSGLLESELFGHERGAFTGAVTKKIGRLELADNATLFLDEIGEISLALQPKLLRVLQDQEFERLGGTQTVKVDFRLIAATNRDLADGVRENEFRSDLYYRLNVFPIHVPPLRERREDIQLLVEHFVHKFSQRMKKSITSIPTNTISALKLWEWPGNIRELENFIERSVILTQGSVLVSPLSELRDATHLPEKTVDETLEQADREHILRALRECRGRIGGLKGAALRLGLKRTTLQSKMKSLGISPRS